MSDGRAEGLHSAGFPGGRALTGAPGQVASPPPPAASNRACGSPGHGSPTSFTAGIRSFPPGPVGPGCDNGSVKADQAVLVGRQSDDDPPAEASAAFVRLPDEQHQPFQGIAPDLAGASSGPSLTGVVLSARLDRYYGHLRRPSGWLPLPGSSPVIGRPAPAALRSPAGPGEGLSSSRRHYPNVPRPLRRRVLHGCASRLFTASMAFARLFRARHSLVPPLTGAGRVTTRQASLDATDRSVARHFRHLTLGFDPPVFQTKPPACYRAPLAATRTGLSPASDDQLTSQSSTTHMINPCLYWTHTKEAR
jgi:hypothetical protein